MAFELRPYQSEAVECVIAHVKKRLSPCLLELATGAGKSMIVAELARFFAKAAPNKRVLCIAPSKELVEQNADKYRAYGYPASIYCASAGSKCLKQQVIFASPQTAIKNVERIAHMGISAIIIDEAHGITQTMRDLVDQIRDYDYHSKKPNEKVRIVGMTATPYRMGTGYIYEADCTVEPEIHYGEDKAINPYYSRLLYRVGAGSLVEQGFLTTPVVGGVDEHYDTSKLELDRMGNFSSKTVKAAFEGDTKTERIVSKVVAASADRMGVMFFAATISHAEEIASYLPSEQCAVVTGTTGKKERERIISEFKSRKIKYLVNVAVLTTGFDAPHVDVVAILRATESAGLLMQIIGRGLRLHSDKRDCLVLDYAENIERHGLQADLFTPDIKARKASDGGEEIDVKCPCCGITSSKKRRNDPAYAGLAHDCFGNFIVSGTEIPTKWNEDGQPIEWDGLTLTMQVADPTSKDEFGCNGVKEIPVPAHYARRCSNQESMLDNGKPIPCSHRYAFKVCAECGSENDIAARHCTECKARMVDPNEKLTETAGRSVLMQDGETRLVACLGAEYKPHVSKTGNLSLMATYKTELGTLHAWHSKNQHWIFKKLATANGIDPDSVSDDYAECAFWSAQPKHIKLKKRTNPNGYAEFKVQSVEF